MVAEAEIRVQILSVEDVAREQTAGAIIVDLRETEERPAHGTIPGALHAPRGTLDFWVDPTSPVQRQEFDPARQYILHCAVGGRSALAVATLKDMGYVNVAQLGGGVAAWHSARKPVEPITALSHEIAKVTGVRGDQRCRVAARQPVAVVSGSTKKQDMLVIVRFTDKPEGLPVHQQLLPSHLEWLKQNRKHHQGVVLVAGSLRKLFVRLTYPLVRGATARKFERWHLLLLR